ncbi:hypothetical protein [Rhodobacter maris]|uniref:Uncharacterized protein n=1 Tax=Rhodobacter maris TaxID=446682 RepID=A0A285RZX2_9RHOB|nr:hypothetical protein [Rhodobacter maris]SOC00078.1 hypothetical protein SAMN05877831_102283 [Rhodobacter maris]
MELREADPKGLIRESYRIEGISDAECRSIFLDWALSLEAGTDQRAAMRLALEHYSTDPAHPMSLVLAEGVTQAAKAPTRRGGRTGRVSV